MNTNYLYQPYQQQTQLVFTNYEARKELTTRLVKEGKITLEEAFLLVGLSSSPTGSALSVWNPTTISGAGTGLTVTNQKTPHTLTIHTSNLNHNFTSK
jgi:hypothetical protein